MSSHHVTALSSVLFCKPTFTLTLHGLFFTSSDSLTPSVCFLLQDFDDFIFAFFAIEMVIKMVALGIFGKKCYLGDTWNRLDFFIVLAGWVTLLHTHRCPSTNRERLHNKQFTHTHRKDLSCDQSKFESAGTDLWTRIDLRKEMQQAAGVFFVCRPRSRSNMGLEREPAF